MIITGLVLLVAGACGGGQEVVTGAGGGGDVDNGSEVPRQVRPGGGDGGLVVSVELGGGLLPPGQAFRLLPQAVVYEDGATLSPAATIAIYPGPALPAVTEGRVDEEVVDQLVAAAAGSGLLDGTEKDFGQPTVMDAATTTVTVVVDGQAYVTSVYALGGPTVALPGITADQQRARDRVSEFVDLVSRTVVDAGGGQYVPERYRVLPLVPDQELDPAVEPDTRDWPLPEVDLREGECTPVSGGQADELGEALESASEITHWRTESGETFTLSVRPVLPHEPDCPA